MLKYKLRTDTRSVAECVILTRWINKLHCVSFVIPKIYLLILASVFMLIRAEEKYGGEKQKMDYSKIHIAKRALNVAGIPMPDNESEIRKKAYEYLLPKDFLAAHSIRIGKNYQSFTKEDWEEVMRVSGENVVSNNMVAHTFCIKYGLL